MNSGARSSIVARIRNALVVFVSAALFGAVLFATSAAISHAVPAAALEPDIPGPRWNTLAVQRGGTTMQQISASLRTSPGYDIFAWSAQRRAYARMNSPEQTIPQGTYISLRTERAPDPDSLAEANLGNPPGTISLVQGWNLITAPENISREDDSADLLFTAHLTDCENLRGVMVVASYSARSRQWSLSLPCHTAAQARLTTGDNALYRPLTSIAAGDTVYIYNRTRIYIPITWNPQTRTYQPGRRIFS